MDISYCVFTGANVKFTTIKQFRYITSPLKLTKLGASVPNYNRINEWPLQFLRTGGYFRSYGYLVKRTTNGHWWSSTAGSATNGHYLYTDTGYVVAQNDYWRGNGFALRCVENTEKYSL